MILMMIIMIIIIIMRILITNDDNDDDDDDDQNHNNNHNHHNHNTRGARSSCGATVLATRSLSPGWCHSRSRNCEYSQPRYRRNRLLLCCCHRLPVDAAPVVVVPVYCVAVAAHVPARASLHVRGFAFCLLPCRCALRAL